VTHSLSPVLRVGHWLLPWVVVVFASAAIAYAISGALAGDASARDPRPGIAVAVSTGEAAGPAADERSTTMPSAMSAELSPSVTGESCPPIGGGYGSYVDSFIVAESRRIACGHGAP
jgi:hypothetical protein